MSLAGPAASQESASQTPAVTRSPLSSPLAREPGKPARTEPRPLPNYDGRPEQPASFGDGALWVPRVLAFPLYVVTEYVIRRPMGWLVITAEEEDWPTKIADFFTFDEEHEIGWVPTAFYEFGFEPSVGLYVFADNAFAEGNDLRANVGFWGKDWLKFSARDRIELDEESFVEIGGGWTRRPDYLFHGMGPRTLQDNASRYSADQGDGFLSYNLGLWRWSSLQVHAGVRDVSYREAACCDDPSIQRRARAGQLAVPAGFDTGYTAGYTQLHAALDTRRAPPHRGGGVRLEVFGEQDVELDPDRRPNRWVEYGGKLGGFVDLTGNRRVLSLWVAGTFVDPLGGQKHVPFSEMAMLGGSAEMRGFREGRLHGRSALVTTLQYEWPIWVWARGTLQVAAGNAFGQRLEDFDTNLLRLSSAIGFRSTGSRDHFLEFLSGVGTETYEQGWEVTSFRLLLGGNSGF